MNYGYILHNDQFPYLESLVYERPLSSAEVGQLSNYGYEKFGEPVSVRDATSEEVDELLALGECLANG